MNPTSPAAAGPAPGGPARHRRRSRLPAPKFLALALAGATLLGGTVLVTSPFQDEADAAEAQRVNWFLGGGSDGATKYKDFLTSMQEALVKSGGRSDLVVASDNRRRPVHSTNPKTDQIADIQIVPELGTVLNAEVNLSNLYVTRFHCASLPNETGNEYRLSGDGAGAGNSNPKSYTLPEGYDALSSRRFADRPMTGVQLGNQAFDNAVQTLCPSQGGPSVKDAARAVQTMIVGISEATRIRQIANSAGQAINSFTPYALSAEDVNAMRSWGKMSDVYRTNSGGGVKVYGRTINNGRDAAVVLMAALGGDGSSSSGGSRMNFVALGDSYSAGTGTGPYLPNNGTIKAPGPELKVNNPPASVNSSNNCQRSDKAYGPQVATEYGGPQGFIGSFTFAACAGAVTKNVTDGQLAALSPETDVVTLTIGGNDVHFATAMTTCSSPEPVAQGCQIALNRSLQLMRNQLPGQLTATYHAIQKAAPNARLIVLGYPKLFEEKGGCSFGQNRFTPYPEVRKQMNNAAVALNGVVRDAVTATGGKAQFVDPQPLFDGHGICSADPFLTDPVSVGASAVNDAYHPNAKGHQQYASLVARVLGG